MRPSDNYVIILLFVVFEGFRGRDPCKNAGGVESFFLTRYGLILTKWWYVFVFCRVPGSTVFVMFP